MKVTIQRISPAYVRRSLIPAVHGTFVVRYATENDSIIESISFQTRPTGESETRRFVTLSIRVDERVYGKFVEHFRIPYTEENIQSDVEAVVERYNQQNYEHKVDRFTRLKDELVLPSDDDDWLLDTKHFAGNNHERMEKCGQNNNGVMHGVWKCGRQQGIKAFIKSFGKDPAFLRHELSILKDLCHPSIVACYGQYTRNDIHYLVLEDGGKCLERCCPVRLATPRKSTSFIANVGWQIANAMLYLEKKNVVHRDLTAGNVLIDGKGLIRVADFGHAIKKEEGRNTLRRATSVQDRDKFQHRFLAPECLPGVSDGTSTKNASPSSMRFTSKSDVWAFGLVIIQMFLDSPRHLYSSVDIAQIPDHVKVQRNIHPQPKDCPNDMYLMLQGCWQYEATDRLSFSDIRDKMYKFQLIFSQD